MQPTGGTRREWALVAGLVAVAAGLGAVALGGRKPAEAQTPPPTAAEPGFLAILGNAQPGGRNYLWAFDAKSAEPRAALYERSGETLILQAARNVTYDLQFDQFPGRKDSQRPSVKEAYEATEKARDDARRGR